MVFILKVGVCMDTCSNTFLKLLRAACTVVTLKVDVESVVGHRLSRDASKQRGMIEWGTHKT